MGLGNLEGVREGFEGMMDPALLEYLTDMHASCCWIYRFCVEFKFNLTSIEVLQHHLKFPNIT